jgi:hypothetical protein
MRNLILILGFLVSCYGQVQSQPVICTSEQDQQKAVSDLRQ